MTTQSDYYVSTGHGNVRLETGIVQPDAGRILLETLYAGINRGDVLGLMGAYGDPTPNGQRVGQYIVGVVREVGVGVSPSLVGRVMFGQIAGAWGKHATADPRTMAEVGSLDPQIAATLPLAGFTALRLAREAERTLGSLSGKRVLITGGTGAVGRMLSEFLVAEGAEMWVLTRRPMASASSNVHYIGSLDEAPSIEVAFESLGPTMEKVLRHVVPGGHVWWFGQATRQAPRINFFDYLTQTPWHLHHFAHWVHDGSDANDLAELSRLVQSGTITPPDHHLIRPADLPDAITRIVGDAVHSKSVVDYTQHV